MKTEDNVSVSSSSLQFSFFTRKITFHLFKPLSVICFPSAAESISDGYTKMTSLWRQLKVGISKTDYSLAKTT